MYIYKITNKMTGMSYIGATTRPIERRMANHWSDAKNGKTTLIGKAIREFGKENFEVVELGRAENLEELMTMEIAAIRKHGTLEPGGYNRASGGIGTPDCRHLESTRLKISEKAIGRTISPEHRQKISESLIGRVPWNAGKQTGQTWNRGIPASAETKAKLSASRMGGKNHLARAIEYAGVIYPSIMDAVRASGLSREQMKARLKSGIARYCNAPSGAKEP